MAILLIGKFANKFNTSVDTVRYYMNLGLLLPTKVNHYYYYNDKCIEDMEWIQTLKEYTFSLQEINKILTIKRVTSLSTEEDIHLLITILTEKKQALQKEIADINFICDSIDNKIEDIKHTHFKKDNNKGVPFTFFSILCCPKCQASLEIDHAKIIKQKVYEGELNCPDCEYTAIIDEGIIITKHLSHSFNPFYIYDIEMLKTDPSIFVNLSEKANNYTKKAFLKQSLNNKFILETNIDTYVFLDKYITELDPNAYYIFTGSTLPMLKSLKDKIENDNPQLSVLYILNSGLDLPLKYGIIDYFIDSYSFNEFSLFHNEVFPMEKLRNYVHEATTIIGCYFQYKDDAKSLLKMKNIHPEAHPNNLKMNYAQKNLQAGSFIFVDKKSVGDTNNLGEYIKYHIPGETAEFFAYVAKHQSQASKSEY